MADDNTGGNRLGKLVKELEILGSLASADTGGGMTVEERRDTSADAERGRAAAIVDMTVESPDTNVDVEEVDADNASVRRKLNFTDLTNTCTSSPAPAGKGQEADSDDDEVPADHGKVRQVMPPVGKNKKADSDVEVLSADHAKVLSMMKNAISNTRPSVLKNFYCFNGARNEFAKRDTDQQTRQDSCLKTFKSVEKVGICELELFNLRNWYNELRFSNIDTPVSDGEGYVWHFRFVMIEPKPTPVNGLKTTLDDPKNKETRQLHHLYIVKLYNFYRNAFSDTKETRQSITLAIENMMSFMVVGVRCKHDKVVQSVSALPATATKIIAAVTFSMSHRAGMKDRHKLALFLSWLNVSNSSTPLPPTSTGMWRRQGFALFLLKCMIKYAFCCGSSSSSTTVDTYLQCYDAHSFQFYSMLGFSKMNTNYDDGFDGLPQHLQTCLKSRSKSRQRGESLFHFFQPGNENTNETEAYSLMLLHHGCLQHVIHREKGTGREEGKKMTWREMMSDDWCQYPPPMVRSVRLKYSQARMKHLFQRLPLLRELLPPPYDFSCPISSLLAKGNMTVEDRYDHACKRGTKWIGTGELDLLLSTILWDGRYNNLCFVVLSSYQQCINKAYEAYFTYKSAWAMHKEETKNGMDVVVLHDNIVKKFKHSLPDLGSQYETARNNVLTKIVHPNRGLLSRRLILFPVNESNSHWSAVLVFNASFINEEEPAHESFDKNKVMRPCFLRYCGMEPTGQRSTLMKHGCVWFLNLCYSMEVHEKKHGLMSKEALAFVEPFGCSMAGTSFETDLMLGTPQFPALFLPPGSNVLPFQHDGYNCGVGVPCAFAIILRDVIVKDTKEDHPEIEYAKYFSVGELPLQICETTNESYCNMPMIWFKALPTKKTLVWDHYLPMVREQWFLLLDRLAELQHRIQPCEDYEDFQVAMSYSNYAPKIASIWPYKMDDPRRKIGGEAPYMRTDTSELATTTTVAQSQTILEKMAGEAEKLGKVKQINNDKNDVQGGEVEEADKLGEPGDAEDGKDEKVLKEDDLAIAGTGQDEEMEEADKGGEAGDAEDGKDEQVLKQDDLGNAGTGQDEEMEEADKLGETGDAEDGKDEEVLKEGDSGNAGTGLNEEMDEAEGLVKAGGAKDEKEEEKLKGGDDLANAETEDEKDEEDRKPPPKSPRPKVFVNKEPVDMEFSTLFYDQVYHVTKPIEFTTQKCVRPLKRTIDSIEEHAQLLLKKIKAKNPKDAAELEKDCFVEPEVREICTQSVAMCEAMITEFGTEMPPVTVLDKQQYNKELEAYIESSFIEWNWHSNKQHEKELTKWEKKLTDKKKPLSDVGKECVILMIKALRDERAKFRKYFTTHFQCTQKTLVRSVRFIEETNIFMARLQWVEKVPIYGPNKMKTKTRSEDVSEIIGYEQKEQEEEIPVKRAWIVEQFGSKMVQQVVNMRHDCHHSWVKTPRDVDVFIGKEKVVRVRYIPDRSMNVVDMKTLSDVVTQELNAYAASVPSSPASMPSTPGNQWNATLNELTPTKLRPSNKPRPLPLRRNAPKVKVSPDLLRSYDVEPLSESKRFVPSILLNPPRMNVPLSAKWTGKTLSGKTVPLDEAFVRMTFGDVFANELMKMNRGFVDIPVGDYKPSRLTEHPNLKIIGGPTVEFVQSEGKDLCVSKSLASAFYALGWHEQSFKIDEYGEEVLKGLALQALDRTADHTKKLFPPWLTITLVPRKFDWNTDLLPTDVVMGVMVASDGSSSHAITIHGGYIFDANEHVGLPLCVEALDYCTSTEQVKSTFVRFKRAWLYRYHGKQPNRIARMTLTEDE